MSPTKESVAASATDDCSARTSARRSWLTVWKFVASLMAVACLAALACLGLPTRHLADKPEAAAHVLGAGDPEVLADFAGGVTAFLPGGGALRMGQPGGIQSESEISAKASPAVLAGLRAEVAKAGLREAPELAPKALLLLDAVNRRRPLNGPSWTAAEAGCYCTGTAPGGRLMLAWVPLPKGHDALFSQVHRSAQEASPFELPGLIEVRARETGSVMVRHLWDDGEIHLAPSSQVWLPGAFHHPGGQILMSYEVPGTRFCIARNPGEPLENSLFYSARMARAGWAKSEGSSVALSDGMTTLSFHRGKRRYVVHLATAEPPLRGTAVTVMWGDL